MEKKRNTGKISRKATIIITAIALVIGAGAFTAIMLATDTEDTEAKENKAKTEAVADEKDEKAADKNKDTKEKDDKDSKIASEEKKDGSKSESNKSSTSSSSSSDNKISSSSSGGSSSGGISSSSAPSHSHSWHPVTGTRQVITGYEYKWVESIRVCVCGTRGADYEHTYRHMDNREPGNTWVEEVYDNVPIYGSETYVDHYKCSCGATK